MARAEESSTVSAQQGDETSSIECHVDLKAFFHETLTRALSTRKVAVPELTEFYLVGLLAALGHDSVSRSLVELSFDVQGDDCARLSKLRNVGDQALSVSGLFDAQLERRGISRSYLTELGSRAYRGASVLARKSRDARAEVFEDLGSHFRTYAELLEDVREATALGTPDDVLALYERFQKTRSPALAERLLGHGVVPVRGSAVAS
ncbi:MAG TPA: hypothetical protein VFX59_04105 [Polyangiales bacterium]|nr:hypothetical protein [Polyangiales bacterium]